MKVNANRPSYRKVAAAGLVLSVALSAAAEPTLWYPNSTWSDNRNTAIKNATMWSTADGTTGTSTTSLNATDDYINKNRTIRFSGQTFTGRLLQIGVVAETWATLTYDGQTMTFPDDGGLVLARGHMTLNHNWGAEDGVTLQPSEFRGRVTLTAPDDAPFNLYASQYANRYLRVPSGIHAEAHTGLRVCNSYGSGSSVRQNLGLRLPVADDFRGVLSLNSRSDYTSDGRPGVFLELGETTLPGTVRAENLGVVVRPVTAGGSFTIGTLEMGDKARLSVAYVASSAKSTLITVTDAFSVIDGKPEIYISGFPKYGNEAERWPVLAVPEGSGLSDDTFTLGGDTDVGGGVNAFSLKAEDADGKTTLYVLRPVVKAMKSGNNTNYTNRDADYPSALTNAANWVNGEVPASGDIAIVPGYNLRSFGDTALDYEFPGSLLVFCAGTGSSSPAFTLNVASFTADMVVASPMNLRLVNNCSTTFYGTLAFREGAAINETSYNKSFTTFESEISGPGSITELAYRGTSAPQSYSEFKAINTNWTGRFSLKQASGVNGIYIWPSPTTGRSKVYVSDERNLGGRLDEFDYAALTLAHYGILEPRCPLAFTNDYNRGILIGDYGAEITTPEGCDVVCTRTMTVDGAFVKSGPGTLALGGDVKFLSYAEGNSYTNVMYWQDRTQTTNIYGSVALTDTPPAEEYKRHFAVTNGHLKALSAGCVDGLTVDFTPEQHKVNGVNVGYETGLKLDFDPADADLRQYGVRNVKTDVPFVLRDGRLKITLENVPEGDAGELVVFGLVTVKTTAADSIDGKIAVSRVPRYARSIERHDDAETGCTTFSLKLERTGTVLFVR